MKSILILGMLLIGLLLVNMSAWAVNFFTVDSDAIGLAPPPPNGVNQIATGPGANLLAWQLFWNDQAIPIPGKVGGPNTGNVWCDFAAMQMHPLPYQPGDAVDAIDVLGDIEIGSGRFFFSVAEGSVGLPWTAVWLSHRIQGAEAGSIFESSIGSGTNSGCVFAGEIGLRAFPGLQDELTGYDWCTTPVPQMLVLYINKE